jgi:hypothetical protein
MSGRLEPLSHKFGNEKGRRDGAGLVFGVADAAKRQLFCFSFCRITCR